MKCEKVRDFLMSDFLDGELEGKQAEEVRVHLRDCKACRRFEEEVKAAAVIPLREAGPLNPPDSVWQKIEASIDGQTRKSWNLAGFPESVRGFFARIPVFVPKPVFGGLGVLGVVLIALLMTLPAGTRSERVRNYLGEQMLYLTGISSQQNGGETDGDWLGTPAELFLI